MAVPVRVILQVESTRVQPDPPISGTKPARLRRGTAADAIELGITLGMALGMALEIALGMATGRLTIRKNMGQNAAA